MVMMNRQTLSFKLSTKHMCDVALINHQKLGYEIFYSII